MSARREKRLRKLEARVAYLEGRVHSVEVRQMDREELYGVKWEEPGTASFPVYPGRVPDPTPPRQSLWRRLLDAFRGRDGTE